MMSKILIVDDKSELRTVLRLSLNRNNNLYDVREVASGEAALQQIRSWRPDMVLLDVMMPGDVDGLQVCREVKSDPDLAKIYIVMLSAMAQSKDIEAGKSAGADTYITKPFRPSEIEALVLDFFSI